MPTDPREFQRLAIELAQRGGPAELRTAIGRAYYAVFNTSAEMLRRFKVPVTRNAAGHGEVLRYLGNSGDAELIDAGYKLGTLRARRNAADYDLTSSEAENANTVRSVVETARRILEVIDACQAPSRSANVAAAIEAYLQKLRPTQPPQNP
jgi:hypothetical protein